jgi:LysR family transcriptional regulator of abg operon
MTLDPRLLRILLAVARERSLSAAAVRLNMTQPSVSIAIAQLEDRVGKQVVIRDRKGAVLTSVGEMLVRHAHAIENVLSHAEQDLRHQLEGEDSPLTIGGTTGALLAIVPRTTSLLQAEGRVVDISLVDATDQDLDELLRSRAVDLVLSPAPARPGPRDIEHILLLREPFLLVAAPGVDLPQNGLNVPQAAGYPWILPLAQGATRSQVEAMFLSADTPLPRNLVRCDLLATMKELVRHTGSLALLPASVVEAEIAAGLLQTVPLVGGPPPRRLIAQRLRSAELSPTAARFLRHAQTLQEL